MALATRALIPHSRAMSKTERKTNLALYVTALVAVTRLYACDEGGGASTCVAGQAAACACETGGTGAQTCLPTGAFSPCVCGGPAVAPLAAAAEHVAAAVPGKTDVAAAPAVPAAAAAFTGDALFGRDAFQANVGTDRIIRSCGNDVCDPFELTTLFGTTRCPWDCLPRGAGARLDPSLRPFNNYGGWELERGLRAPAVLRLSAADAGSPHALALVWENSDPGRARAPHGLVFVEHAELGPKCTGITTKAPQLRIDVAAVSGIELGTTSGGRGFVVHRPDGT